MSDVTTTPIPMPQSPVVDLRTGYASMEWYRFWNQPELQSVNYPGKVSTSDDVPEGLANLYFTNIRAQSAVASILQSTPTITFTYLAGSAIEASLNVIPDSGVGTALLKITRDSYGRVSGTQSSTTTDLAEGSNLYFTAARVLVTILAGLSTATNAVITAADTVLSALGKLQAQITANVTTLGTKADKTTTISAGVGLTGGGDLSANRTVSMGAPSTLTGATTNSATGTTHTHALTLVKADVGLGNVDNTSDVNKPVSTAQAASIATKEPVIAAGTTAQLWRGDKTWASGIIGNFGVGTASPTIVGNGTEMTVSSSGLARLNLQTTGVTSGNIASFSAFNNSVAVAQLTAGLDGATDAGVFRITTKPTGGAIQNRLVIFSDGTVQPGADNSQTLGSASARWSVVYAGTGTINTSDAREKTAVVPLTADEMAAAKGLAQAIGTYQWLASVQAKGADARQHIGLTVQRAIQIMQGHGLDPFRYGFICYDEWGELPEIVNSWPAQDAVIDDAGNVTTPAIEAGSEVTQAYRPSGDRYSFRTDELLLFIARGFAARLDALESKA